MTPFITRACLAASAVLCFAIEPASAQYNISNSQSGLVTDVIVNGVPVTLDQVEQFEERCNAGIDAGRWWRRRTAISAARAGQRYTTSIPVNISGKARKGRPRRRRRRLINRSVITSAAAGFAGELIALLRRIASKRPLPHPRSRGRVRRRSLQRSSLARVFTR